MVSTHTLLAEGYVFTAESLVLKVDVSTHTLLAEGDLKDINACHK